MFELWILLNVVVKISKKQKWKSHRAVIKNIVIISSVLNINKNNYCELHTHTHTCAIADKLD